MDVASSYSDRLRQFGPGLTLGAGPPLLVLLYKAVIAPRPFWAHFYDPEMIYFYGALRIAEGRVPSMVQTPGGPVHILGVPLVALTGQDPLAIDTFRLLAYAVVAMSMVAATLLLQATVLRGLPALRQASAVWIAFAAPEALRYMTVWSPESLYFFVGSLAVGAMAVEFRHEPSWRRSVLTGIALGVCVATKVTFVAWLPAYALAAATARGLPRSTQMIGSAAAGTIGGFALAAAPILPNLRKIIGSLLGFASHSGAYGTGERTPPSLAEAFESFSAAMAASRVWHLVVLLLMTAGMYVLIRRERRPMVAFALAATMLTYAIAIRDMQLRYLMSNGMTMAVLFAATIAPNRRRMISGATVLLSALVLTKAAASDIRFHSSVLERATATHSAVQSSLASAGADANTVVIYGWRAEQPSYALRAIARDPEILRRIEQRWPHEGHYDSWTHVISLPAGADRWRFAVVRPEDASRLDGHEVAQAGEFVIVEAHDRNR